MTPEILFLWTALGSYFLAGLLAFSVPFFKKNRDKLLLALMATGVLMHTLSLGMRWERLGHGPFVSLFEIISSNLWSLMLLYLFIYWRLIFLRSLSILVLPLLFILIGWLLVVPSGDSTLPASYATIWLYIHVFIGKIFLGSAFLAATIGLVILLRWMVPKKPLFPDLPDAHTLDELAYRFIAIAFVFDTLMLIAGSIWAQDAWGRYWDWDPLEVWSLINWLIIALIMHLRPLFHIPPSMGGVAAIVTFLVAFINFFGIPFISQASHRGVV